MRWKSIQAVVLMLCTFAAVAEGPQAVRKQVVTSMLAAGTIDIATDGSVASYRFDEQEKMPEFVIDLANKAIPAWRFEPVMIAGKPVKARAKMGVRFVANQVGDGSIRVSIQSASFGDEAREQDGSDPRHISAKGKLKPPAYPPAAYQYGVTGEVYLVLRIGRDGKVVDVVTEQVNLRVVGSEKQMQQGRDALARASVQAARRWTFKPPTVGDEVDKPYWSVRVPVDYRFNGDRQAKYGEWEAYVPGPRQTAPWVDEGERNSAPDAMLAGGVYPLGAGPRLLTPLGEG